MKNRAISGVLFMLVMILAATPVMAVKSLNITEESFFVEDSSGVIARAFHLRNTGNETINATITADNAIIPGRSVQITPYVSSVEIAPSATQTLYFNVNFTNAYMGLYTGRINAYVQGIPAVDTAIDTAEVKVNVTDNNGGLMIVSPAQMNATESDATVYQKVIVQNTANRNIEGYVAKGDYSQMSRFSVDRLGSQTFPAFSTTEITSAIEVPASLPAGSYSGHLNISYGSMSLPTATMTLSVAETRKVYVGTITLSDLDPGQEKTATVSIQNRGNVNLTGLYMSNFTIPDDDTGKVNITFSPSESISVNVGSSASVTAKAQVSKDMDSGKFSKQTTVQGNSLNYNFNMEVEVNSILKVSEVEFDPEDVKPGESFDVKVTVENVGEDIDLEDVEVEVYLMDGNNVLEDDDEDEIKDDVEVGKLGNGDEEELTFTFTMPVSVEDGDSFGVKVVVKGENEDNSAEKFEDIYEREDMIEVEKEEHEVEIFEAELDSSTLSCVKTTYIKLGMRNIGADDEDAILTVRNDQIGLRVQDNFELVSDYDDDDFEMEKSYLLDFSSAPSATYPVIVLIENEDGDKLGSTTISITIQDCSYYTVTGSNTGSTGSSGTTSGATGSTTAGTSSTTPAGSQGSTGVVYTTPSQITGATVPAVSAAPIVTKTAKSAAVSPLFIVLLVAGNILLLAIIVLAVMYMMNGSKKDEIEFEY